MGKVKGFLGILAGIGMFILGGTILYFWILNIFNPEIEGHAKGIIAFVGGFVAFIGYAMVAASYESIRKGKESAPSPSQQRT